MFLFNLLDGETPQAMDPATIIIMAVLIVGIIGLFVWQTISGKKKQKQAQDMVNGLKIGDRVKTIGGICGFVVQINDAENTFVLETGLEDNKSYVKFDKGAIYQTAPAQGNATQAPSTEEKPEEKPAEDAQAPAEQAKPKKPRAKKAKPAEQASEPVAEPVSEPAVEEKPAEENK